MKRGHSSRLTFDIKMCVVVDKKRNVNFKESIQHELSFSHSLDEVKRSKTFPLYWKLQTIFSFLPNSENLAMTRIILATFPTYPNCCLPANAHPPALPSRLKQKLKTMFNCHLWCGVLLAYTHFHFHNFPLVLLGLCFHSETATSFWCWSYEDWGILQLLLGPRQ